MEVLSLMLKV